MTSEKLHEVHSARPFRPFRMNLADGRRLDVRHPEMLAYRLGSRSVYFVHDDDRGEHVDLLLVVLIEDLRGGKGDGGLRTRRKAG